MAVVERDVLIVGGGHAGAMAAIGLRQNGFSGSITMVGDEAALPYERPPLSKAYLNGSLEQHRLYLRKAEFWQDRDIDVRLSTSVTHLDAQDRTATLSSGETIRFTWCILATGGRARPLPVPGAELAGVHYLRTLADVDGIRASLAPGARLAVVGGGYIGLEVAASARKLGHEVTLIEALDRVLARVTSPVVSRFFETKHRQEGVNVLLNTGVTAIEGNDGRVTGVRLSSGEVVPADAVVVGIGIIPNCELAIETGLACDNGIVVDELCRTANPNIFAIGDVARHPNVFAPGPLRLESVPNAVDQAKTVVGVITDNPVPYADLPWFWSDQYDIKLQAAGLAIDYDDIVVRGSPEASPFSVCYLRNGTLIAIDCINSIKDFMAAKKLIASQATPDRALLADPAVALKDLTAVAA